MRVIRAVIVDLAEFALSAVSKRARGLLSARQERLALPGVRREPSVLLSSGTEELTIEEALASTRAITEQRHFVGSSTAMLYIHPSVTFDGAVCNVPYGSEVLVNKFENRFASVSFGQQTGWMLKDALYTEQTAVFPQFLVGATYESDHQSTKKLRAYIGDSFSGAASHAPLSSVEYVTYRLARLRKEIPWGSVRPRIAGNWQRLLKGERGVHIGIVPKTGAVMEYHLEDVGHLAYVDAVAPDGTVRVSMIADDDASRYLEVELSEESWKELRPVFIQLL